MAAKCLKHLVLTCASCYAAPHPVEEQEGLLHQVPMEEEHPQEDLLQQVHVEEEEQVVCPPNAHGAIAGKRQQGSWGRCD